MAYCTAADVKLYGGISSAGDDTLITALIARAQQMIDTFCKRTFEAAADTTRKFDIGKDTEGYRLWLDKDLASIASITNGDGTTVTSGQYVTIPRNDTPIHGIELLSSAGITWTFDTDWQSAIQVEGEWAYSAAAPNDIVHACVRLAHYLYRQKDTSLPVGNARSIVSDAGVTVLPGGIPVDIGEILRPYRRVRS